MRPSSTYASDQAQGLPLTPRRDIEHTHANYDRCVPAWLRQACVSCTGAYLCLLKLLCSGWGKRLTRICRCK